MAAAATEFARQLVDLARTPTVEVVTVEGTCSLADGSEPQGFARVYAARALIPAAAMFPRGFVPGRVTIRGVIPRSQMGAKHVELPEILNVLRRQKGLDPLTSPITVERDRLGEAWVYEARVNLCTLK